MPIALYGEEPAPEETPVADASTTALGSPVASATLAEQRGGDETQILNTIHIDGDVTDNTASNVVTGANNIQNGSFDNASGVFSVVQNTGANVLIQSATIVNVQFADP
jgi:prolyl-tRNA editing enzyme YbaK/EbsC (Cys-tRNA(Pro) deacylase)